MNFDQVRSMSSEQLISTSNHLKKHIRSGFIAIALMLILFAMVLGSEKLADDSFLPSLLFCFTALFFFCFVMWIMVVEMGLKRACEAEIVRRKFSDEL